VGISAMMILRRALAVAASMPTSSISSSSGVLRVIVICRCYFMRAKLKTYWLVLSTTTSYF
jgi:hypothetical protein